jgi:hypothetical protein
MSDMRLHIILSLALSTPAAAQGWKEIGKTSNNSIVSIDPKSVKTKDGITTARIQVKFGEPVATPQGAWRLSRSVAMFDCAKKKVANKTTKYYSDLAATKVVEERTPKIPGYGVAFEGSMTGIAMDYLCKKK